MAQVYDQMLDQIQDETGSLPDELPRRVPPEVAAANPDVQAIIAPRLTMLVEIANSFLLTILDSIETVPYGIRWICKQIVGCAPRISADSAQRSLTRVRLASAGLTDAAAQIPRGHRLRHLLPHRRLLLPPLRQPGDRHATRLHALRRVAAVGDAPQADAHAAGQDAAEPGEQAELRQGAVHGLAQPVRRVEQAAHQRVPQPALRGRRLLRDARGAPGVLRPI